MVFTLVTPKLARYHQGLLIYTSLTFLYVITIALAGSDFERGTISYLVHFSYLYLAIGVGCFRKNAIVFLISFFALFAVVNATYGLIQLIGLGIVDNSAITGFQRVSGFFPNPNMAGTYTAYSIAALLYLKELKFYPKIFLNLSTLICISYVLITFSRRAYIMMMMMLIVVWFFKDNKLDYIKNPVNIVLISMIFGFFILNYGIMDRILTIADFEYEANSLRITSFDVIFSTWTKNYTSIFLGAGVGNFGFISKFFGDSGVQILDNYWLMVVAEFGLLGFMLLVFPYFRYFVLSQTVCQRAERMLFTIVFLQYIVSGIVGVTAVTFPISFFLSIFLALGINSDNENRL
jgi:hypothetical protein